jgi:CBS domain-containing protein
MMATVEEIMRRDVAALRAHDSILKAWRLMLEHGLNELPVVDTDGRLLGIFCDRPRTARPVTGRGPRLWGVFGGAKRFVRDYRNAFGKTVGELMMPVVVSIEPDATVQRAAVLLRAHGVGMLVVVSAGVVVGLVTRADIIRAVPA